MAQHQAGTDGFDVGSEGRDELFGVLSDSRRRFVLHFIRANDAPVSLGEVVTELVAWEVEQPVDDRTGEGRDGIELSLVHNHLPKMDEAGVVDYDATRRTIALGEDTADAQAHLQTTPSN